MAAGSWRIPIMLAAAALVGLGAVAEGAGSKAPRVPPATIAPVAAALLPRPGVFTVAVLGDGFAETLALGLRELAADDPGFAVVTTPPPPAGTQDVSDWEAAMRALLAGRRVDAVVVTLGANGRTPLPDGDGVAEPGSPRWRTLYGERVAHLADLARINTVPLVWVGLPIVADEGLASDYAEMNGITRDRVLRAGASFVDSWDAFADDGGRFDRNGPDKNGHSVRLRTADGRGFTHDGAIKLASFAIPVLRRSRAEASALASLNLVLPSEAGLDTDINAEIRRELGLPALAGSGSAPPKGETDATPVLLTAPPAAPDGHLVAADVGPAPLAGVAASLAQRTLVEGRPIAPKPDRIDDFAWPSR